MDRNRTSVLYSRTSRDFEAIVDGAVVGHAGTYSAGYDLATRYLATHPAPAPDAPRLTLLQTREDALAAAIKLLQTKWFQAVYAGDEVAVLRLERREASARREWVRLVGREFQAA